MLAPEDRSLSVYPVGNGKEQEVFGSSRERKDPGKYTFFAPDVMPSDGIPREVLWLPTPRQAIAMAAELSGRSPARLWMETAVKSAVLRDVNLGALSVLRPLLPKDRKLGTAASLLAGKDPLARDNFTAGWIELQRGIANFESGEVKLSRQHFHAAVNCGFPGVFQIARAHDRMARDMQNALKKQAKLPEALRTPVTAADIYKKFSGIDHQAQLEAWLSLKLLQARQNNDQIAAAWISEFAEDIAPAQSRAVSLLGPEWQDFLQSRYLIAASQFDTAHKLLGTVLERSDPDNPDATAPDRQLNNFARMLSGHLNALRFIGDMQRISLELAG